MKKAGFGFARLFLAVFASACSGPAGRQETPLADLNPTDRLVSDFILRSVD